MALLALLLIPCAEASTDMTVKLEGTATGQDFPALLIHLARDGEDCGHLRIRFPEGIDANLAGTREHLKFYQDLRSPAWPAKLETEPTNLPVDWAGDDQSVSYEMTFDNGMVLKAKATVDGATVTLSYELLNATDIDLSSCQIWSCNIATFCPPIADHLLERTGIMVDGSFRLFRDLVPTFKPWDRPDAEYQRFGGYPEGTIPKTENPMVHPHPGFPDDPTKSNYFYHATKPFDFGVIATTSIDGTWAVATIGEGVNAVWTNPGISCQHADPAGKPLPPGETLEAGKTIHLIEGDTQALEARLGELAP
ncbi:MAG TPA: hypothetical protein QGH10_09595 [Armatimonadota bacterium]|nr:hypothetical protein [Armatimonadota bacterium]